MILENQRENLSLNLLKIDFLKKVVRCNYEQLRTL